MSSIPSLGGAYTVPPSVMSKTIRHLRQYRTTEAVCFWLGLYREQSPAEVTEMWVPEFRATPVSYDIQPIEMLRLKEHLTQSSTSLLVQVHSHPGAAFHSSRDDMNAASPWPGFMSIVVPDHGQIADEFLKSVEIYELLGGTEWRHLSLTEKLARFILEERHGL